MPASPAADSRFHAVLARYERPLLGYATVRCGDHSLAQDAVQETLLRFVRHNPQGDVESLGPWLFTACRNVLTDFRRKSPRSPGTNPSSGSISTDVSGDSRAAEAVSPESAPDEALADKETAHALRRLITALPEIQQQVVRLKFETGLAYRDIAAATGLSIANVGWLLHQAVATLRQDWRRLETVGSRMPASCP
ncbi:MAG: sigma-70 family RNA polymerase sigma factor [Verrucomicrobiaceae bacterium]|nr:MAG: sigma-70 family RNA polymerase sigma factor [Verrucomicrobiaceae bacterium]